MPVLRKNTYLTFFIDTFHQFWRRQPALLYGLAFIFGVAFAFGGHWTLIILACTLLLPLLFKCNATLKYRLVLAVCVALVAYFYTTFLVTLPEGEIPIQGEGIVSFSTVTKKQKFSQQIWEYRGTIKTFMEKGTKKVVAENVPCIINLHLKKGASRPLANQNYLIEGSIVPTRGYYTRLTSSASQWTAIPNTFSLAELRNTAKLAVSEKIRHHIPNKRVYEFLKGIATGDFQDEELQFEFSRFGLQHIMAISGFHFAIVAGFFCFFIRLFAPRKTAALILVFLMCSYFLFLGSSPSIMRAWMMILVAIGGCFFERQSNGLNSLGIAVITILAIDPMMIHNVGFQFSSLITGGILLCYPSFDFLLQNIFSKRPLYEVVEMSLRDQHGYCVLVLLRKVLALSLTVNLISAPLAIYYFQKFPLLGLVYNWFFPFMVSLSITLLIVALMTSWIPPLSELIHSINMKYTDCMLDVVYNMPTNLDVYIRYQGLQAPMVILFVAAVFFIGVFMRDLVEKGCQEKKDFAFI